MLWISGLRVRPVRSPEAEGCGPAHGGLHSSWRTFSTPQQHQRGVTFFLNALPQPPPLITVLGATFRNRTLG